MGVDDAEIEVGEEAGYRRTERLADRFETLEEAYSFVSNKRSKRDMSSSPARASSEVTMGPTEKIW